MKKRKVLIVFHHMITDMEANKKLALLLLNCFYEEENLTFHLLLSDNFILKFLKL